MIVIDSGALVAIVGLVAIAVMVCAIVWAVRDL